MGVSIACSMNPKSAYRDHLEPQVQDAGIAAQAGKSFKTATLSDVAVFLSVSGTIKKQSSTERLPAIL